MLGEPCKTCGAPIDKPKGRLCRKCYNIYRRALPWYKKKLQDKAWNTRPKTCEACKAIYKTQHTDSRLCSSCFARQRELKSSSASNGQYKQIWIDNRQIREHRYLAEQLFSRKLGKNEHIHHLNGNSKNNELDNLLVLSRSNHVRLHGYLDRQRVIEEKQGNPKPWSELVKPLSLQWLRDNKIPHLRLSELKTFKDQLLKHPKISKQPDLAQHIVEDRIQWRLYPESFKITAEIPEGLFKANGD